MTSSTYSALAALSIHELYPMDIVYLFGMYLHHIFLTLTNTTYTHLPTYIHALTEATSGLSTGAIAGISIAAILIAIVIFCCVVGCCCYCCRHSRSKMTTPSRPAHQPPVVQQEQQQEQQQYTKYVEPSAPPAGYPSHPPPIPGVVLCFNSHSYWAKSLVFNKSFCGFYFW